MDYGKQLCLKEAFTPSNVCVDRKIVVEEIVRNSHSNTTLIRKISRHKTCGGYQEENLRVQVLHSFDDKTRCALGSKFQDLSIHNTAADYHNLNNYYEKTDFAEEPMEVDSSSDQLLLSHSKTPQTGSNLNFRRRCSKNSSKSETSASIIPLDEPLTSKFYVSLVVLSLLFTITGVYIVIAGDRYIFINRDVQLQNIREALAKEVLHQDDAINIIVRSFEQMDSWREPLKILPFIGSTGVGKTLTANIIKNHFFPHLIHEVSSQNLATIKERQAVIDNLNACCCNLIIIDDLKASELYFLLELIKMLPKSQHLLLIPVFNIQEFDGLNYTINKDDFKFIRDEFDKAEVYHELVVFDVLKHHAVEEWLRGELHKRNVDRSRHDSLIKFLLDNNHVKHKGFKGLNAKLLLAVGDAQ